MARHLFRQAVPNYRHYPLLKLFRYLRRNYRSYISKCGDVYEMQIRPCSCGTLKPIALSKCIYYRRLLVWKFSLSTLIYIYILLSYIIDEMVEKGHDWFIFSNFIAKREMMITVAITADRVAPPTHYLPALMKIYCCEKLSSKCRRCSLCYNLHITKQNTCLKRIELNENIEIYVMWTFTVHHGSQTIETSISRVSFFFSVSDSHLQ